jgi:moderate conductance mechanosensitive channel
MMSSAFSQWPSLSILAALHLLEILIVAMLVNRLLRASTNLLIRPASTQSRVAQAREQQTRTLANRLYNASSKVVWGIAILTALPEFGINVLPPVVVIGATLLGLGCGARSLAGDLIAGFQIVFEDQYSVGDTIQTQHISGKVEQLTLRRTVVRDARGALVTIANGDLRAVGNLSRDWSQTFVDITVGAEERLDKTVQALENASAALRNDASWSNALIDGPRVLGIQGYEPAGLTFRVQVRTAPTRQDEVARELRRRIQIEFQRQSIPISRAQDLEHTSVFPEPEEKTQV